MARRLAIAVVVLGVAALPAPAAAAPPASCGIPSPSESFTGHFTAAQQGAFVFVPFDVPAGTTQVRVGYCWDDSSGTSDHTLDLGVYDTRADASRPWGRPEFRGWGGSGYRDVTITPQGFSTEAQYDADRRAYVPGRTMRSFVPGPLPAGPWAAELGLANIDPTDLDGGVDYRVEVRYYNDPSFDDEPYTRPAHDPSPVRTGAAWYAGDFHVHAEHSGDAQASFTDVLNYAFRPRASGGPGLDFVAITDHNTGTGWPEEDRRRSAHPRNLILRGEEVTTYRGHTNNIASGEEPDYRTGPLYQRQPDSSLTLLRGAQPVSTDLRHGQRGRRHHPDQPPHDLPVAALPLEPLPRLRVDAQRYGQRLLQGGLDRGGHGAAEARGGAQPVHPHGDRLLRRPAAQGPSHRRRRRQRRPPGRHGHGRDRRPHRAANHGRACMRAVRGGRPPRDRGGPHLREGRRPGRPGPSAHGASTGVERSGGDHRRHPAHEQAGGLPPPP